MLQEYFIRNVGLSPNWLQKMILLLTKSHSFWSNNIILFFFWYRLFLTKLSITLVQRLFCIVVVLLIVGKIPRKNVSHKNERRKRRLKKSFAISNEHIYCCIESQNKWFQNICTCNTLFATLRKQTLQQKNHFTLSNSY